jgi:hypothetical protein
LFSTEFTFFIIFCSLKFGRGIAFFDNLKTGCCIQF